MRQLDFLIASTRALAPTSATAPTAAAGGGAGFGAVFNQVQNEVAAFIERGGAADGAERTGGAAMLSPEGRVARARAPAAVDGAQQQFLDEIAPLAQQAGQRLGVAPEIIAAHAALESGWGRRPLRGAGGADSHNLFGLKAGGAWRGAVAEAATTEYEQGAAHATSARFRSYPDQASAFRDYTQLLSDNPRFRAALNTGADARAFAQGLADGGYATDPAYADKLSSLATRLQRAPAAYSGN